MRFEKWATCQKRLKGNELNRSAIIKKIRLRGKQKCGYKQTNVISELDSAGTEGNVTLLYASCGHKFHCTIKAWKQCARSLQIAVALLSRDVYIKRLATF